MAISVAKLSDVELVYEDMEAMETTESYSAIDIGNDTKNNGWWPDSIGEWILAIIVVVVVVVAVVALVYFLAVAGVIAAIGSAIAAVWIEIVAVASAVSIFVTTWGGKIMSSINRMAVSISVWWNGAALPWISGTLSKIWDKLYGYAVSINVWWNGTMLPWVYNKANFVYREYIGKDIELFKYYGMKYFEQLRLTGVNGGLNPGETVPITSESLGAMFYGLVVADEIVYLPSTLEEIRDDLKNDEYIEALTDAGLAFLPNIPLIQKDDEILDWIF